MADGPDPAAETFATVVETLEGWEPGSEAGEGTVGHRLRRRLVSHLNPPGTNPWEAHIVEHNRSSHAADVVVDGEIGVAIVHEVRTGTLDAVRTRLALLADQHTYLAVYWWDALPQSADSRRLIERRYSARRLGLNGLEYVSRPAVSAFSGAVERGGVGLGSVARQLFLFAVTGVLAAAALGVMVLVIPTASPLAQALLVGVGVLFLGTLVAAVLLT